MQAVTVRGNVNSEDLGITLTHEHLLLDLTAIHSEPKDEARKWLVHAPLVLENMGEIKKNQDLPIENLKINDVDLICDEIMHYRNRGGNSLVELTPSNIGRNPVGLKSVAEKTGINVIAGCGYYIDRTHPPTISSKSVENLADEMVSDLTTGIGESGVRAGIIGEVGISMLSKNEEKVLRAAARASKQTGAPINVHTQWGGGSKKKGVVQSLDILEKEGIDLSRVAMSHLGEQAGEDYVPEIANRWAYLSFDCFGFDLPFSDRAYSMLDWYHGDYGRIRRIVDLINKGFLSQILISHDVCFKTNLKKYGGYGYDYILSYIVPMMKSAGLTEDDIRIILVDNPKRLLGWHS